MANEFLNEELFLKSLVLKYYKREDVQQAIADTAQNKEVVGRYGGQGFAKRPDTLQYASDVFSQISNGITSFHVSEESWRNPLMLDIGMKKNELNDLRVGWDLVLDIDCPYWQFSKITAWLFIESLKKHGVTAITAKFSGNKGFHIAVPFEAFPKTVNDKETKDLFPEGPRRIAAYLLDHISNEMIKVVNNQIVFNERFIFSFEEINNMTEKSVDELTISYCTGCKKKIKENKVQKGHDYVCKKCESSFSLEQEPEYVSCPKCDSIVVEKMESKRGCSCGSKDVIKKFNPLSIVDVDTILISPRHLFRSAYSLHEKSGLASVPLDPDKVLEFEKDMAKPENVKFNIPFMDRKVSEQARHLIVEAFDFDARREQLQQERDEREFSYEKKFDFEDIQEAIPEQFFPPCIQKILGGVEDGKKRAVFVLINFLLSCAWSHEQIEERLRKWNEKNADPLREVYYLGQLRYAKTNKKKILPPNCDNKMYYKDLRVCCPDKLCQRVKNPVNYAIRKTRFLNSKKKVETKKNDQQVSDSSLPAK